MTASDSTVHYCQCGCGLPAPVATKTDSKRGVRKGDVSPYKRGHHDHGGMDIRCACGCELTRRECRASKAAEHLQRWQAAYPNIPYGACCCGCGQRTGNAPHTTSTRGWVKGRPKPFLKGHNAPKPPQTTHGVNETGGFCECGCGQPANLATQTLKAAGCVRGEPRRFLSGHYRKLLSKVLRSEAYYVDHKTGCWVWQLSRNAAGYGTTWHEGRSWLAHRLFFTLAKGDLAKESQLDHLCRNPPCVNPDHLEAVTNAENCQRGAKAKLTMADAREIRQMYATGAYTQQNLAVLFEVHAATVNSVTRNKTWVE